MDDRNRNLNNLNDEYVSFLILKNKIKPWREALKIIILYLIMGTLWILLSDKLVEMLFNDMDVVMQISLYKGWFYVFVTGMIFYIIIRNRLRSYEKAVTVILKRYEELLETHKALSESELRYELAVSGSKDGIWDWDIKKGDFFFSLKYKEPFCYTDEILDNSLDSWNSILHPEDYGPARERIDNYLKEKNDGNYESVYRIRCKSGEYRWISSKGKAIWDKNGEPIRISGSHTDITELREMQEKLRQLAYYDKLTGLPNRILFESQFYDTIREYSKVFIVDMDIDNFRHINNTLGYVAGDFCIKYITNILTETLSLPDYVSKTGGEQFGIIFACDCNEQVIYNKIEFILNKIRKPIEHDGQNLFITVSMGVSIYPDHGKDFDSLMQNAEIAMFNRKDNSKDGFCIYESSMYERTLKTINMGNRLKEAIKNKEFQLYYQPEVDLSNDSIVAVEALIRWQKPDGGFIPPLEFIPFSEKTGHILEITKWVITTALLQRREWVNRGIRIEKVAVNLSGYIITDDKSINEIYTLLKELRIRDNELEIEVTETAMMMDMEKARENLFKLRDIGISIALDDFGAGYSSLTYLSNLPLDILKIDREFIKNIKTENEDDSIYKAILNLSHNMNLRVLAEGVEIKEQKDFLIKNYCDIAQGYYFCKPLPADKLEEFIKRK